MTADKVIGNSGGRPVRLRDLSKKQLAAVYAELTEDKRKRTATHMRKVLVERDVPEIILEATAWCEMQGTHKGKWVHFHVCRERQRKGRCPKTSKCPHRLPDDEIPVRRNPVRKQVRVGETKVGLLRSALKEKPEWTRGELIERTGFDEKNLKTAINLLKNPKRTRDPFVIIWDRKRSVYVYTD